MAQVAAILTTLKASLKGANIRYSAVAEVLSLSESSVKRKFSRQEFSLAELDKICNLAGMDITELVKRMEQDRGRLQQLSEDQEREIAIDLGLLIVTVCVLNHWKFAEIIEYYTFSEHELIRMLVLLDRLRLIELLPGNRIKLLVATNFSWRPNGPIERVFLRVIQQDFFATRFDRDTHELIVLNGMLSDASNKEFQRRLERLAREFDVLNQEDSSLPLPQRHGYTVLLALRDWRYSGFKPYLRADSDQA